MNKWIAGALILGYCFPYAFYSMYMDFANCSMIGYILMLVMVSLLSVFAQSQPFGKAEVIIGNLLSATVSFFFLNGMNGDERWDGYFKPLTPTQLVVMVSVMICVLQFFIFKKCKESNSRGESPFGT